MTDEEKKNISNELDELLNNPTISISSNTRDVIKISFVSAKSLYISENIELKWYKTAQNYISILKTELEKKNIEKVKYKK